MHWRRHPEFIRHGVHSPAPRCEYISPGHGSWCVLPRQNSPAAHSTHAPSTDTVPAFHGTHSPPTRVYPSEHRHSSADVAPACDHALAPHARQWPDGEEYVPPAHRCSSPATKP